MLDNGPQSTPPEVPNEPTVLDLFKSITKDWRSFYHFLGSIWDIQRREQINRELEAAAPRFGEGPATPVEPSDQSLPTGLPWRTLLAVLLGLYAQLSLEPPGRNFGLALPLYAFAAGLAVWAFLRKEWRLPGVRTTRAIPDPLKVRFLPLFASVLLAVIAFWDFGPEDKFTASNLTLWISSIILLVFGFWLRVDKSRNPPAADGRRWLWLAVITATAGFVIFFRLNQIDSVPAEPFSDHAEKILDIYDITQGQWLIFFPRNTGREGFQMYWTLLVAGVFGTGLSFLSLKLGTVLLGLLTLPYIYLLGVELGGRRLGLIALVLFGIGYWPNLVSRIGLRFPLYPLFVASCLFYVLHGLRTHSRNDFILAGLFLGLGLHGYSPFRIVPVLILVAFGLYWLHRASVGTRQQALWWLMIIIVVSLVLFLPLLRYSLDHPDIYSYRAFSRLGNVEAPLPDPALQIFLSNLGRSLAMFNWDDGEIWVNSVPHRPAFDVVTAAFFLIGFILLLLRYIRERDWRDLFILVSIPVLLLPSSLSLAFPAENPALNRAAGAAVPAFLVSALALDGFLGAFSNPTTKPGSNPGLSRSIIQGILAVLLLAGCAYQNYDLVFNQFDRNFRAGAWNTSEMGKLISRYRSDYGTTDSIWIVPYPHWVDTRLPGVWAGIPNRDFARWPENLPETQGLPAPKLFMFNQEDHETEQTLRELYPGGILTRYVSATPGKDFFVFLVER